MVTVEDRRELNRTKDIAEKIEIELKCLVNTLELVHHGYLALGQTDDDFATLELSFVHTLKSSLENLCNNEIKELRSKIEKL